MTELQHILLLTIELIEILPLVFFANCIIKASLQEASTARVPFASPKPKLSQEKLTEIASSQQQIPPLPDLWLLPPDIEGLPQSPVGSAARSPLPQPSAPKLLLLPEAREQTDYAALNSAKLRALCSERGIRWRGVRRGKHLTKIQMVERLVAATA